MEETRRPHYGGKAPWSFTKERQTGIGNEGNAKLAIDALASAEPLPWPFEPLYVAG